MHWMDPPTVARIREFDLQFVCFHAHFSYPTNSMRANANLVLVGPSCVLVPYRNEHVDVYHGWMRDPQLREATASEPLTLQEEFEMQQSWSKDETKCTFIVCVPGADEEGGAEKNTMVGDVNLFWNDHESANTAEIEIMIAEPVARRKGIAQQALRMMMAYAIKDHGVNKFVAKIGFDNGESQNLFRKMGFAETSTSDVFRERTLSFRVRKDDAGLMNEVETTWAQVSREKYDDEEDNSDNGA